MRSTLPARIIFLLRRMVIAVGRSYTPAEAAALSGVALKAVHNAIDKNIVEGRGEHAAAGSRRRTLLDVDLLRLKLWYGVGAALASDRRQRLFEAIIAEPAAATVRADEFLIVDVAAARQQLAERVCQLEEAETLVHCSKDVMGGEPVFKGTRVPVRTVASMLAQGADVDEVAEGYPSLTPRMVELSAMWSTAHPARGRPRKLADDQLEVKASRRVPLKGDPRVRPTGKPV